MEMSNIVLGLTYDVISDPEVIKICFPLTSFPGLSNGLWISKIGPVVSELGRDVMCLDETNMLLNVLKHGFERDDEDSDE